MSVIIKGGTSGNREKNAIVSMPAPVPQPVLDTATSKMTSNVHFTSDHSRSTHPANAATPDFMPKGCTVPESGPDIEDFRAGTPSWGPNVALGTPPDANR